MAALLRAMRSILLRTNSLTVTGSQPLSPVNLPTPLMGPDLMYGQSSSSTVRRSWYLTPSLPFLQSQPPALQYLPQPRALNLPRNRLNGNLQLRSSLEPATVSHYHAVAGPTRVAHNPTTLGVMLAKVNAASALDNGMLQPVQLPLLLHIQLPLRPMYLRPLIPHPNHKLPQLHQESCLAPIQSCLRWTL